MSDSTSYVPLESEIPSINTLPEDVGDVMPSREEVLRKRLLTTRRGYVATTNRRGQAQSYAAQQAVSPYSFGSPTLDPASAKPEQALPVEETRSIQYRVSQYKTERRKMLELQPGDEETILSETEDGELVAFMLKTDDPNMIGEIAVFGDLDTYYTINDLSIADIVSEGGGMTPGEIAATGSISPDNMGTPDPAFMWVARWKLDTGTDELGNTGTAFVVKYTPSIPFPYKAISVTIRNNSTVKANILNCRVHRIIYSTQDQEVAYSTKI